MAKSKTVTCEVLTAIKGLDPKKPGEYTLPGTAHKPNLVELDPEFADKLTAGGALRIWPGPPVEPAPALNVKDLKSLAKAETALVAVLARLEQSLADPELGEEDRASIEADQAEVEADLALVKEALK
jgi:hypothetical protein